MATLKTRKTRRWSEELLASKESTVYELPSPEAVR